MGDFQTHIEQILQRITALETITSRNAEELRDHMRAEPELFARLEKLVERSGAQHHAQIVKVVEELEELRMTRSREKGFWAGALFVFTAAGGVIATLWHKVYGG